MEKYVVIAATLAAVAVGVELVRQQIPPIRKSPEGEALYAKERKPPVAAAPGPTPAPKQPQQQQQPGEEEKKGEKGRSSDPSRGRSVSTDSAGAGVTMTDLVS